MISGVYTDSWNPQKTCVEPSSCAGSGADWPIAFLGQDKRFGILAPSRAQNRVGSNLGRNSLVILGKFGGVASLFDYVFCVAKRANQSVRAASVKAREAALRAEISRLKVELTCAGQTQTEIDELRTAIELERSLREEADLAAFAAAQLANEARADRPVAPPGKLQNEIEVVLETLLPGVRLIRDSLIVIAAEFLNRRALYRGLAELRIVNGRLPPTWKKLKGLDAWWERHMSDGQDDAGRVYARLGSSDRVWDVLISHKSEQARDIAWLARQ
jgi:hypothetical protein